MASVKSCKSFVNCCRTCLCENSLITFNIFESKRANVIIAQMLMTCTGLKVDIDDGLPKHICDNCFHRLIGFYNFLLLARKSYDYLREKLNLKNDISSMGKDLVDDIKMECVDSGNFDGANDQFILNTQIKNEKCDHNKNSYFIDLLPLKDENNMEPVGNTNTYLLIDSQDNRLNPEPNMGQNEGRQNIKCKICSSTFKSIPALHGHMRKHVKKGRVLICTLCNKTFCKISHLKRHELCHSENRPYKCTICPKTFLNQTYLTEHIDKHNGIKPHVCSFCSKAFSHLANLTNHIKAHNKEKRHLCPTCGKKFYTSTNLNQHLNRHTGHKLFACSLCPKQFVSKGELKSHFNSHTGEKSFTCDQCDAKFRNNRSLVRHRQRHLGVKPHKCDLCPMKFINKYHLKRHSRIHTGEKPYLCEICDKVFTQSNGLIKHLRAHLGDKLYKCSQCEESFRLQTELRQHESQHYICRYKKKEETDLKGCSTVVNGGAVNSEAQFNINKEETVITQLNPT